MWKCPHRDCDNLEVFEREQEAIATQQLDREGNITNQSFETYGRAGNVRCICGSHAEWRDARQEELFAVEPAMFG